jgi:hypothetical protein
MSIGSTIANRRRAGKISALDRMECTVRISYPVFAATLIAASLTGCSSGSHSVFEMEVGMCFNAETSSEPVSVGEVPTVACSEPHDAEVFYIFNLADIPAYDEEAVTSQGFDGCVAHFQEYVGVDYYADEAADLGIYGLYPSATTWADDDREIVCSIASINEGEKLTGSVKDSLG